MSDSYTRTAEYEELPSSAGEDHPPVLTLEFGTDKLKCLEGTGLTLTMMLSKGEEGKQKLPPVGVIGIANSVLPVPGTFYYMDSDELEALSRTTASLAQMLRNEAAQFERENAVLN